MVLVVAPMGLAVVPTAPADPMELAVAKAVM